MKENSDTPDFDEQIKLRERINNLPLMEDILNDLNTFLEKASWTYTDMVIVSRKIQYLENSLDNFGVMPTRELRIRISEACKNVLNKIKPYISLSFDNAIVCNIINLNINTIKTLLQDAL